MARPNSKGVFLRFCRVIRLTVDRFSDIDGTQRAAAFSYYAFFSLFPLMVLFVSVGSLFMDRELAASQVISYVENQVPIDMGMKCDIFNTITSVVEARKRVSVFALLVVLWGASQFLEALIRAVNRAWGTEMHSWWRMPLQSLLSVGIMVSALFLSMVAPTGIRLLHACLPESEIGTWTSQISLSLLPTLIMFYALSLFYKLAPRRPTNYSEVWFAGVVAALLQRGLESLFVVYLRIFASFNAIYGVFGGLMALLMWVYLSGCIVILGACLSSAQAEMRAEGQDR
jgi:YihY family inner membrane protein